MLETLQLWSIPLTLVANFILVATGLFRGLGVLVSVRDEILLLRRDVGSVAAGTGLTSAVHELKNEVRQHRDALIAISGELDGIGHPGSDRNRDIIRRGGRGRDG